MTNHNLWRELSSRHPGAIVLGCSTGGEAGSYVLDMRTIDLRNVIEGAPTIVSPSAGKAG